VRFLKEQCLVLAHLTVFAPATAPKNRNQTINK
jgi:hypothetical protein